MKREYVVVKDKSGKNQFLIWNCDFNHFETHSGNVHWHSWQEFKSDFDETEDIDYYTDGQQNDIDKFDWDDYELEAPDHIKNLGIEKLKPADITNHSQIKKASLTQKIQETLATIFFVSFFIGLPGFFVTEFILKKIGIIEQPQLKIGYEKYLETVKNCKETKTIYSKLSKKHPTFQIHVCSDGTEKIWKYEIEVIEKASNNRWIIE